MSLLREIQNGATDSAVDISTVLRKARTLAAHLKSRDLADWLDRELNGYPAGIDVPEYRTVCGSLYGTFVVGAEERILPIPIHVLPEQLRNWEEAQLREPIAAYAAMFGKSKDVNARVVKFYWPPDMARLYGSKAYTNTQCLQAWMAVDPAFLAGLLDTVRNRLLTFALAIEGENPEAGETDIGATPVEPEKVTRIFQTNIYGGTNSFQTGDVTISQNQHVTVQSGDFEALRKLLEKAGVNSSDINELETDLETVESPEQKQQIVDSWLCRTARTAYAAGREFMMEFATKVLAEYMKP